MCVFKVRFSLFLFLLSTSCLYMDLIPTSNICSDLVESLGFPKAGEIIPLEGPMLASSCNESQLECPVVNILL